MATPTSSQIVDDFENSFQACLAALTNPDYFNVRDSEEVKTGVEQTIQRFLDLAKQMECFFLQKRLLLSVQKPEHIVLENNSELKNELARKEQLLNKYYDKIQTWQSLLKEVSGAARPPPPPPQAQPPQNIAQQPQQQQQQPQQSQQQQQQQPQMPMMQGPPMQNVGPPQPGAQGHPHHMMPPHCMPQQQPMTSSGGSIVLQSAPQMHPQPHMGPGQQQQQQQQGGLPGPLAYLERTMSNIGIPDGRG